MKIRINGFVPTSFVDGPGERAVVFTQGCPHHCPGCQSPLTWNPQAGSEVEVDWLASRLASLAAANGGGVTISGGDPFLQPAALAHLVATLNVHYQVKDIVVYTGYTWEELFENPRIEMWLFTILRFVSVIVDGKFIQALDDDLISYRGSRNQRPIDVQASLMSGDLAHPVILDWDAPILTIAQNGSTFMPVGVSRDLEIGTQHDTRMCGQREG